MLHFPYTPHALPLPDGSNGASTGVSAQPETAADGPGDFSERLLRTFLGMCENPRTRGRVLKMVKASVGNGAAGRRFYALLNRAAVHPAARVTGVHASALRVELVCGQLVGLAMMRYVLGVEPVASTPLEDLVRQYTPAIRATVSPD